MLIFGINLIFHYFLGEMLKFGINLIFNYFLGEMLLSSARGNADCLILSSSCTPPSSHFPRYILYILWFVEERMPEYMLDIDHSALKTELINSIDSLSRSTLCRHKFSVVVKKQQGFKCVLGTCPDRRNKNVVQWGAWKLANWGAPRVYSLDNF